MIFKLLIITILLLGIALLGIGVKVFFKKGGQFAGTCSSQNNNPLLKEKGVVCSVCGAKPEEQCKTNS